MKILCMALILASCATALAKTQNEADYPVKYEVMNTIAIRGFLVGHFCTMTLRDTANPNTAFGVLQRGRGCRARDSNSVLYGRREKDEILLLVGDKGNQKVEHWTVVSTVAIPVVERP